MNSKRLTRSLGALLTVAILAGCASTPPDDVLIQNARNTLERFIERDPSLQAWVDHAHSYAIYPEIGKGGFGVGGSFGRGIVFENGRPIGRTSASQGTIGAQIGVQTFSQVIFFQDDAALRTFQRENLEFSAQATAVAARSGAAATTSYERGVAVFILVRGGLMAEATIGGQKFHYTPL